MSDHKWAGPLFGQPRNDEYTCHMNTIEDLQRHRTAVIKQLRTAPGKLRPLLEIELDYVESAIADHREN